MMTHCEIKLHDTWTEVSAEEARIYRGELKRCKSCWGAVHLYPREGGGASAPHFSHNVANPECPKKHPQPLE
jgi:hypothetical protein